MIALLSDFVERQPFEPLPLERVTVVHQDLAWVAEQVTANRDAMEVFVARFNIEVRVHLFAHAFPIEAVERLAPFVFTDALDELGFFFAYQEGMDVDSLRQDLSGVAEHWCVSNAKVRLGNFPACFFPGRGVQIGLSGCGRAAEGVDWVPARRDQGGKGAIF